MDKRPKITEVNILFFIFETIFLVFQVLLVVLAMVASLRYGGEYYESFFKDNIYAITLVSELVIILVPVLIFIRIRKLNFKTVMRFNKPGIAPMLLLIPASFGAYLVAMMLNGVAMYFIQFLGDIPRNPIPVPGSLGELAIGILVIAVTPAFCEELMHRGLMLSAYERRGTIKAVVITSLFFGIFHFDISNLLGPVFLGLLIGYYVIRTNSIWAGIFAHFLNNTLAELHQYFFNDPQLSAENVVMMKEDLFGLIITGFIGIVLLSGILAGFHAVTSGRYSYTRPISSIGQDIRSVITHWPVIVVLVLYVLMAGFYLLSISSA